MTDIALASAPAVTPRRQYATYLPHVRRRWLARQVGRARRREEAWAAAQGVAGLLRAQYGAIQIIAFGSLIHPERFDERSDIDLAVAGVPPAAFFRAWGAAGAGCPFALDLVDLGDCSPSLRELIDREGVSL